MKTWSKPELESLDVELTAAQEISGSTQDGGSIWTADGSYWGPAFS